MTIRHRLQTLANNLWWTWTPRAQSLFQRILPDVWERSNHNPLAVLAAATAEDIARAYASAEALEELRSVSEAFHAYMGDPACWVDVHAPALRRGTVAYLCAEFGLHEALPLYSGGLGVLAGDHVKTASDLGIPFVAIGLKYPEGYFQQSIDAAGWQVEDYPATDWRLMPAELVSRGGQPLMVDLPLADRTLYAQVWAIRVGRTVLYLLDTNVAQNNAEDRGIGGRLYSGGSETRIRQEMVLGVGGVRLVRALGLEPTTWHLNEGHSAFACLELMREDVARGLSFDAARQRVRERALFTTHTPVPAGHDRFGADLMGVILWRMQQGLGVDPRTFLGLGREDVWNDGEPFCMTVLALKCARYANGVSALHGAVSREMWANLYPNTPVDQVPIGHVTNGIHVETFLHPMMRAEIEARAGHDWANLLLDPEGWGAFVDSIDDNTLLRLRRALKLDMVQSLKTRMHTFADRMGPDVEWSLGAVANWRPDTLTIGFARRFATYKRGAMLFSDMERAVAILANTDRPVQLVFAGKAHPQDIPGKEVIRRVIESARDPRLKGRVLFLQNYDMGVARALVSGVDVWLNTPRRPREASGTSGQKVCMHGGINASILDGWWDEGFDNSNGYAIGGHEVPTAPEQQDLADTEALYRVLEEQLIPDYYAATTGGTSPAWIAKMRGSIRSLVPMYSTRRMLRDYIRAYYEPMASRQG